MFTIKVLGMLIALGFGVAIGTSDPIIMGEAVGLITVSSVVLYITQGD